MDTLVPLSHLTPILDAIPGGHDVNWNGVYQTGFGMRPSVVCGPPGDHRSRLASAICLSAFKSRRIEVLGTDREEESLEALQRQADHVHRLMLANAERVGHRRFQPTEKAPGTLLVVTDLSRLMAEEKLRETLTAIAVNGRHAGASLLAVIDEFSLDVNGGWDARHFWNPVVSGNIIQLGSAS